MPRKDTWPKALKESDVTKQVVGFVRAHGFECIRLNAGLFQRPGGTARIRIGTRGMSDWICLKADPLRCFFLEIKRPGEPLRPDQQVWHEQMRQRGFTTVVASDLDELIQWFKSTYI